ncbi:MAG: plastocyanin/azurin family copper-binding protein [Gemmatimonadota bacterium]
MLSRREALPAIGAVLLAPMALSRRWPETAPLPPRTIGLRSLGGAFRFDPPGLRVPGGATVTWLNIGDFHTVTSFHPDNDSLVSAPVPRRMPAAAPPFHSGMLGLSAGSVFERDFPREGVYDYFCQPHYGFGMVGRLVVGRPTTEAEPYGGVSDLPEAAGRELPRVSRILGAEGRGWEWHSRVNGILLMRSRDADPAPAAGALEDGVAADDTLADALGTGRRARLLERLQALTDAVSRNVGYETLVQRSDEAKAALDVSSDGG